MNGNWRVWQWAIEIRQGSHGQSKISSSILPKRFDNEKEAWAWGNANQNDNWGNWSPIRCGQYVDLSCNYEDLPKSYSEAVRMAEKLAQS